MYARKNIIMYMEHIELKVNVVRFLKKSKYTSLVYISFSVNNIQHGFNRVLIC